MAAAGDADQIVPITTDHITLGQLCKFAGVVDSGADVRSLLEEGSITVNGEPETRRGRKLRPGDAVTVPGRPTLRVRGG
jgi:ribosome-associated protein